MSSSATPMKVNILDKEYLIGCPDGERDALFASAEFLNEKMKEIRDQGKIVGIDRIAVMAALNIAHDLLDGNSPGNAGDQHMVQDRIRAMQDKIDSALNKDHQLEL